MTRQYTISIRSGKKDPQIADNIIKDFRCVISEPSVWLTNGNTTERGLTFLNKNGSKLNSSLFKHQAYFHRAENRLTSEEKEIEELIYNIIVEHYHIVRPYIRVKVSEMKLP